MGQMLTNDICLRLEATWSKTAFLDIGKTCQNVMMFSTVQVLLLCLFGEIYAQHRNQPTQAAQRGTDYRGHRTAAAPYSGEYDFYASLFQNAAPYSLRYDALGQYYNRLLATGPDGSVIPAAGPYAYPPDASGLYRQMNYADAPRGFRANLATFGANQQGPAPGVSNIAAFNAAPIIQPVPTDSAQESAAAAYGPRAAAPNAVGYGGYDRSTPDPYALASRAFESAQYGSYGYSSGEVASGEPFYSSFSPYGPAAYVAGYSGGVNEATAMYGGQPAGRQGYRRR